MAASRINGGEMGDNSRVTLRYRLQSAVQSIQWTYTVFWKLSPQQGELVWADGYYNGSVKTRKTIIVRERSPEEHGLQRSDQLRELFESLSASGDGSQSSTVARRPTAALSPEDLTDTEWFYLVCMSCTFDPGTGIPGQAFAKGRPVWLCKANEASTKVFSRALLAKTACIQTVVCIPLAEGVLELGSTELVREDTAIVQHVISFFVERAKPTLSEQSISSSQSGENGHEELQPALHAQQPKQPLNAQPEQLQTRSAFCHWRIPEMQARQTPSSQQAMLKNVLLRVPHMYAKLKDQETETNKKLADNGADAHSKSVVRKDDEVNTAHAMLERRRRFKLNERFLMLRNLVPFVTKMDKASILGDTIEYLKQLKKRVAELEQYNKRLEAGIRGQDMESSLIEADKAVTTTPHEENFSSLGMDMAIDGDIEAGATSPEDSLTDREREQACPDIQVSQDMGSIEIQCASRKGILLDIFMTLSELNLDVPAVQANTAERSFRATLKTEVKDLSTMVTPSVEDVEDALQRVTQLKAAPEGF